MTKGNPFTIKKVSFNNKNKENVRTLIKDVYKPRLSPSNIFLIFD